jgi:hypothetical protein
VAWAVARRVTPHYALMKASLMRRHQFVMTAIIPEDETRNRRNRIAPPKSQRKTPGWLLCPSSPLS